MTGSPARPTLPAWGGSVASWAAYRQGCAAFDPYERPNLASSGPAPGGGEHMPVQSDVLSSRPSKAGLSDSIVLTQSGAGCAGEEQSFTLGRSSIPLAVCSRWPGIWRTATMRRGRHLLATDGNPDGHWLVAAPARAALMQPAGESRREPRDQTRHAVARDTPDAERGWRPGYSLVPDRHPSCCDTAPCRLRYVNIVDLCQMDAMLFQGATAVDRRRLFQGGAAEREVTHGNEHW